MNDRTYSTTIRPNRASGILPPVGPRRDVFLGIWKAAQSQWTNISGLTCIDAGRAYFQIDGDRTFYSVSITADEAATLGYMA